MPAKYRPRVFVVMPFGIKEAGARERTGASTSGTVPDGPLMIDFDEVYAQVLAPALKLAGCDPFRADQESGAGDIRTDMFFELVTADAVLADISILNANVFYELGIRHGVAARGVFMVHAGWSRRPFDIAPDRTFTYDGQLLDPAHPRDEEWAEKIAALVDRLGSQLRAAIAVDDQTIGSPLYKEVVGLKPADWSEIQTARAKYFQGVLDDWRQRVVIARRNGHPGDILTLAGDAPTRLHRDKLLIEAAKALIGLQRFPAARDVLKEVLAHNPGHFTARCLIGMVLGRMKKTAEASEMLQRLVAERPGNEEAHGKLGRVHKDSWRSLWDKPGADLTMRQQAALDYAAHAERAIHAYASAQRLDLDSYYNGVNVVTLAHLLAHLGRERAADANDLFSVVKIAATHALERSRLAGAADAGEEAIWAEATLGELELVAGDGAAALRRYVKASAEPGITRFQIESMLHQVELLELLGFRPDAVGAVAALLRRRREEGAEPRAAFQRVLVSSGHMIDEPGRESPRFPPEKELAVRAAIEAQLDRWGVGPGDLAICGGARGADILFAEACQSRGAYVRLFIALPEDEFVRRSVRLPTGDWVARFYALTENCETACQHERLGEPPPQLSPFARCNLWIIQTARAEAPRGKLAAILVWDRKENGDGPGGTSHFAAEIEQLGGDVCIIDPTAIALPPRNE